MYCLISVYNILKCIYHNFTFFAAGEVQLARGQFNVDVITIGTECWLKILVIYRDFIKCEKGSTFWEEFWVDFVYV